MGTPESSARNGRKQGSIPEEVLAAARATWPHATREFERQGSTREAVALAADIWEAVLRSVARAFQRKGEYASSIGDLESYLLTAFRHSVTGHTVSPRRCPLFPLPHFRIPFLCDRSA